MQQIMRIGNDFVPADDDLKDIGHTNTAITDVAQKYQTDVLAVIGKGEHNLVTQCRAADTQLEVDIIKLVLLVEAIANTYDVDADDIADAVKLVTDKLKETDHNEGE